MLRGRLGTRTSSVLVATSSSLPSSMGAVKAHHNTNINNNFSNNDNGNRGGMLVSSTSGGGSFRPTTTLLIPIPPMLLRILTTMAMTATQVFMTEFARERQRLQKEKAENGGDVGSGAASGPRMTPQEALQILNINTSLAVPLTNSRDQELAKENFQRFFKLAQDSNLPYIQGKLSAAYRMCVDKEWDSSWSGDGGSKSGRS